MAEQERDRAAEFLEIIDRRGGFATVVVTMSGRVFACSLDDVREAVRRRLREREEES
jgi:hypothetical protein